MWRVLRGFFGFGNGRSREFCVEALEERGAEVLEGVD